jgi:hypothetical protein
MDLFMHVAMRILNIAYERRANVWACAGINETLNVRWDE